MDKIEKLLNDIKENGTVIIGAGLIARKFYEGLEGYGLDDKVACFAVSSMGKNPDKLFGKAVVELKDLVVNHTTITCIAGHRYIAEELIKAAETYGLHNIVWVGDLANRILWGKELELTYFSTIDIIKISEKAKYNLAVRYLAAAQSYGKNDCGWEFYRKAMSYLYSEELVESRTDNYKKLIDNVKAKGLILEKNPICVDFTHKIIDGLHRASIASFLGKNELLCQVYEAPNAFNINESLYLTKEMLQEAGFSEKDITIMQETADKMLNK